MKGFVKWCDNAPLWLKIILALPIIGIFWGIYRIVKGAAYGKTGILIAGIVWIILGGPILWIVDIISIIVAKKPVVLA